MFAFPFWNGPFFGGQVRFGGVLFRISLFRGLKSTESFRMWNVGPQKREQWSQSKPWLVGFFVRRWNTAHLKEFISWAIGNKNAATIFD